MLWGLTKELWNVTEHFGRVAECYRTLREHYGATAERFRALRNITEPLQDVKKHYGTLWNIA